MATVTWHSAGNSCDLW